MGENQMYVIEDSKLRMTEQGVPGHFHVKGHFEDGHFIASGILLGDAALATDILGGKPGWFELSSQKFYSQQTAQAPVSPYIIGYMTHEGFVPSKREVY